MRNKCLLCLLQIVGAAILSACGGAAQKGAENVEQNIKAEQQFDAAFLSSVVEELVKAHGEGQRARAELGVKQVSRKWRGTDGSKDDFKAEPK